MAKDELMLERVMKPTGKSRGEIMISQKSTIPDSSKQRGRTSIGRLIYT